MMNTLLSNPRDIIFDQAKKAGNAARQGVKTIAQDVESQLGMEPTREQPGVKLPVPPKEVTTKDVVKGFYEPSHGNEIISEMKPEHKQAMISQQKSKDQQDLLAARQKMQTHMQTYWKPMFEEHPKIEEQKEEQEEKQKEAEEMQMKELEENKKKREDVTLRRAQTSAETKHGVGG